MTLFGRRHAVELVRQVMASPQDRPPPPVLVFEGGRGVGKSALLDAVATLLDGRVPFAHIDLRTPGRPGTPEVLFALAFHLGRPCPLYGTLRFPRLAVGKLIMDDAGLDLHDRDAARRRINELLRAHRGIDQLVATIRDGAGNLPAVLPSPVQAPLSLAGRILAATIGGLAHWTWSSRFVLGQAQKWYGTRGSTHRSPVEILIELNQWHRHPERGNNARQRDDLLWAAFHADLAAGLGRRRRRSWMPRCVVLLDNADTRLGRTVLTDLVRRRSDGEHDPLAVVVTARQPFLDHLSGGEQRHLGPDEALRLPDNRPWPRWMRYRLTRLTDEDIARKVSAEHVRLDHRIPLLIQQFAQGNPLAVSLLLETADKVAKWPEGGGELAVLLHWRETPPPEDASRKEPTIAERLCRRLLGIGDNDTFPDETVETVTTCAAARTGQEAGALAVGSGLLTPEQYTGELIALFNDLWPADHDAPPPPLRRLLLRRLADRPADAQDGWVAVHERLRQESAERGDRVGELYHLLALGELGQVAAYFTERAGLAPTHEWLTTMRRVVTAPRNLAQAGPPADEARRLARLTGADPESRLGRMTRLVAGLWVLADPFSGRDRASLHDEIKREYRAIALQLHDDQSRLVAAADAHRVLAERWQ
ncbi:hypothetical protein [Plantactinospora sp. KLBMP9567]|uniref:hypothetical protein n=1 Tax=Plantactinospora sp. KLBMP9567 TaxID=3085900 RepID=UPI002981EB0B|nr:hypothetical protein [Plantactinospora sp. KLBMP9567]MDW5329725.1 hypothetical protein [Plantactinospora sp. KLBMP9567]